MAPSIEITGHKHQAVRTIVNEVAADGVTVTDHTDTLIERVWATFAIKGAEPHRKTNRSITAIQPVTLHICYQSVNGDPWKRSGTSDVRADGWNVKADGHRGADASIRGYDLPEELVSLYASGTYGVHDAGPAFEWINSEYPR
jgi:hypothetical protein